MEREYNKFPDKFVSKQKIVSEYFEMSVPTLDRRIKEARALKQFKNIFIGTGGKLLINVRGFYLFMKYRDENKYRVRKVI